MAMETENESFATHLIEEDGTLNDVKFDQFLEKVNLAGCGLNYAVVSIMGPQSSGKSTLLNHLFGSKFEELDGRQRRGQTTKGIWMARCAGIEPCTLVMDVEGSDGRERGEDDTSFERQSGVFAFAVSHIVLINMFYTSVGLDNGASKPLLKNVFQGVLRLSTSPRKTTLMFVIRDIVRTTPLKNLDPILREDINKIWDSIPKPEGHKRTPLSTFFEMEVVGLPNYVEREEQFKEQVKILRQLFNLSIEPGGLAGDSRKTILGSDFSLSVQEIWKTIKEDRELDLPKHEVMVANIRCGEIADKMLKEFVANKERRQLEEGAQTNPATGFGKKYNSIINSYLHGYDKETEYYDGGFRSEKREHLKEKMMQVVQSAFPPILANIGSKSLKEFKKVFFNLINQRKDAKKAAHNCKEECLKSFDDRCADVIVEQANCNTKEEREKLELAIENDVLQVDLILQEEKRNEKVVAAGVGGAVMATGVISGAAVMSTVALPVTVVATAASGIVAGATFLGALAGKSVKAYKSRNRKISQSELEPTELEGNGIEYRKVSPIELEATELEGNGIED